MHVINLEKEGGGKKTAGGVWPEEATVGSRNAGPVLLPREKYISGTEICQCPGVPRGEGCGVS